MSDHSYDDVPSGNTYNKYESNNPIHQWLLNNFQSTVFELLEEADPESLLDVGCGEAFMICTFAEKFPDVPMKGIDLADPELQAHWEKVEKSNIELTTGDAHNLPFEDNEFQTITCLEVLEHLQDPEPALDEMVRVAEDSLIASVPREPIWRILNMLRGAYLTDLGNTPGHLNHWSTNQFVQLLESYGDIRRVETPLPWTIVSMTLSD